MKLTKTKIIALAAIPVLIGLDQLFKFLAVRYLTSVSTLPIIEGWFHLTYVENYGAAFGIFTDRKVLLIGITSVALLGVLLIMLNRRVRTWPLIVSLALIVGGGVGNLLDRIVRGFVVDYLQFVPFNFPVFNFADCCVVVGTFLLVFFILFEDVLNRRKKQDTMPKEDWKDGEQKL